MTEAPDESNVAAGVEEFETSNNEENETSLYEQYKEITPTDTMPGSPVTVLGKQLKYMYTF